MEEVNLSPRALIHPDAAKPVRSFLRDVRAAPSDEPDGLEAQIEAVRRRHLRDARRWPRSDRNAIAAVINLFSDLAKQGWRLSARGRAIRGLPPSEAAAQEERSVKRQRLSARRNEQLREPATREFIQRLERGQFHSAGRASIFSLMRDGRELAVALNKANLAANPAAAIEEAVRPYIQFVSPGVVCPHTGFALQDIWRYFRHTWSNPYESVPGRSMLFLVRDAAAASHPVMGLGAISSAAMQLEARDRYIGWQGEQFLADCRAAPHAEAAEWALTVIDRAIAGIYSADFIRDEVLPCQLPVHVPKLVIENLRKLAREARTAHQWRSASREHKSGTPTEELSDENWEAYACLPLFQSKRAGELASLLALRNVVREHYANRSGGDRLVNLLSSRAGQQAFVKLVRIARSVTVGTEIADLTVCGAVPPYNEVLGGKLTAMLAVSPEVITQYKSRYSSMPSVIASSMAGRRVVRAANLAFLGTTSLYGVRPNQYDRVSIPCALLNGDPTAFIRYQSMESRTAGVGTFHFSKATKETLEAIVMSSQNGRRVNNVFGEGTNPKLRALRDGLTQLGFDPERLLKHGLQKTIYGIGLLSNLRDYLLGFTDVPNYLFSLDDPSGSTRHICTFWAKRWVEPRIKRPEILDRIKCHTLIHPIRHGARVQLPEADVDQLSFRVE